MVSEDQPILQVGAMRRSIFYVSCHTGISVETLGQGLLTQFHGMPFEHILMPYVNTVERAIESVAHINAAAQHDGVRPIVFTTLISPEVRQIVAQCDGLFFDFLGCFIEPLGEELGIAPTPTVGLSHGMVDYERYKVRIDAVQFAQLNDESLHVKDYNEADLILVGVSRSGKTPTCLYLALQFGLRAANFTLQLKHLEDGELPAKLKAYRERLFGLTIAPERLHQIRNQRNPDSDYASFEQCRRETELAEQLLAGEGVPCANATAVSIEEIATKILHQCKLHRRI